MGHPERESEMDCGRYELAIFNLYATVFQSHCIVITAGTFIWTLEALVVVDSLMSDYHNYRIIGLYGLYDSERKQITC